jgi:acetyl-CoA carboxylase carboxyl transferase subunit beta
MVDMVVHRRDLRATISRLCRLLTKAPEAAAQPRLPVAAASTPASTASAAPA